MTERDANYLNTLSILYYVKAALFVIVALFPLIHFVVGLCLLLLPEAALIQGNPPPPQMPFPPFRLIGAFFVVISSLIMIMGWVSVALAALGGWSLSKKRNYVFCLIVAGLFCTQGPVGIALGAFSFVLLLKPEVKAAFQSAAVGVTTCHPQSTNEGMAPMDLCGPA